MIISSATTTESDRESEDDMRMYQWLVVKLSGTEGSELTPR